MEMRNDKEQILEMLSLHRKESLDDLDLCVENQNACETAKRKCKQRYGDLERALKRIPDKNTL